MTNDEKEIIKNEIEVLRKELNEKINLSKDDSPTLEIIELSQRLDDLIIKYIKITNN